MTSLEIQVDKRICPTEASQNQAFWTERDICERAKLVPRSDGPFAGTWEKIFEDDTYIRWAHHFASYESE